MALDVSAVRGNMADEVVREMYPQNCGTAHTYHIHRLLRNMGSFYSLHFTMMSNLQD